MYTVYHNLGLGDHLICNGLIRELKKGRGPLGVYCKNKNLSTVQAMFRDDPEITVLGVPGDDEVPVAAVDLVLRVDGPGFDRAFYARAGIDFECRWTSWKYERDRGREMELANKLLAELPDGRPYVMVADTSSLGTIPLWVPKSMNAIRVRPLTDNLFDWLEISEGAQEIHAIDSAYFNMVQSVIHSVPIRFHMLKDAFVPTIRSGIRAFT